MNNRIAIVIMLIILILVLVFLVALKNNSSTDDNTDFKVYFFNAGKADCILISNKDKHIMIDTGEDSLGNQVLQYLNKNDITKLDYLIITHFDKDHVGSASKIIDNIAIDNVLQSNCPKESEYYSNYLNSLEQKSITPQTISGNYSFSLEDLQINVNRTKSLI